METAAFVKSLFRSLRHRNYRLFWSGQLISLMGTWMQNVGQAWLVLELTHSPFKLGVVSALQFAPMLILSFPAGAIIDTLSKRRIIIATQTAFMILAFTLALLDGLHIVRYWHVAVLAALFGIVNTFDIPARQSFIIELVGREDLMNGIALNSSIFNAARAVGPAIAGLAIGVAGTAVCFLLNGLSFLAVIVGLLLMNMDEPLNHRARRSAMIEDIREAFVAIRRTPAVLGVILLVGVVSVFGTNFNVLVPVFSRQELHRDAAAFGLLMSSFGAGALIGAIALAALSRRGPAPELLLGGGVCLSLVLIVIGLQRSYGLTAFLLMLAGLSMVVFFGIANTTVQLNTEDRLRGRVMSVYTFVFGGFTPFGSLFAGAMAHSIRAPRTFAIGGIICAAAFLTAITLRRRKRAEQISPGERP
ncbi:MAG TPA: MFS transporter [Nitrospirota bacterium]|nr:MFS transporter [Nitrospirota bacterium]